MSDNRFCYGANCTWFGPISEVSNTDTHPRREDFRAEWERAVKSLPLQLQELERRIGASGGLPCCPHCGGMLFETTPEKWWTGVDKYSLSHPGYREMLDWQRSQAKCFKNFEALVSAFSAATGKAGSL